MAITRPAIEYAGVSSFSSASAVSAPWTSRTCSVVVPTWTSLP